MNILETEIELFDKHENSIKLKVFSESGDEKSLQVIDEAEALDNGEALVQLFESFSYEYELSKGYRLEGDSRIIKESPRNSSSGRITPGIYIGTLTFDILEQTGEKTGSVSFEVKSVKVSYREDYRFMLENITEYCTDLLMQYSSPVTQSFTPDFDTDPETLYQRFAFVKSVIDTDEFNDAVYRILSTPVTAWSKSDEETDMRRIRRLGSSHLRQIASRSNRIKLIDDHALKLKMSTIPSRISTDRKVETVDTPENRFIKHALEVFRNFCSEIRSLLLKKNRNLTRAYKEARQLEEKLGGMLNHDFFRVISPPVSLPLNSPILQRKEGYREVLRIWLMFDLAAKMIWKGGEDVYNAGKRDVAILYEYWLFFKLLEILKDIFVIDPASLEKLIEPTVEGLGLKIKSGKHIPLKGIFKNRIRDLKVEFSYNRTFSGSKDYPIGGSWSKSMRPDYTLSFWPADFISQEEAEKQELIVHIHFDAKYKVERLKDILGDDKVDHDNEKYEQRSGTYKRADLLKMHAYKDAIRRTGGAYVLYPGCENEVSLKGFHEIIPGLGAFAVRPSQVDDGSEHLKSFIKEIVKHLLNRTSQHDRITYKIYDIFKNKSDVEVREPMPEHLAGKRTLPPADTYVLVGYCKSEEHYNWIQKNGLYNFRVNSTRGSVRLTPEAAGAFYLLLHSEGELKTGDIRKITEKGPKVFSKQEMIKKSYPTPLSENYLVYTIENNISNDFSGAQWDIRKLPGYKSGRGSGLPFAVSLADLMNVVVKKQ